MTTKQQQLTADALNPVMTATLEDGKITEHDLLLVASVLKRIAIRNKYGDLDAHWAASPAFDELGNGQPHTAAWQEWSRASAFVDDVDTVADAIYAYLGVKHGI